MSRRKSRANASEINKSPDVIRYVWMLEMNNSSVNVGTTYQTIQRADLSQVKKLYITDLKGHRLFSIEDPQVSTIESIMEAWREEYFNEDWDIEDCVKIKE